jgi:2-polyprenyl-3-methyl-5-hydroxy-6-metoxy-1,4-benzoquinol methylase
MANATEYHACPACSAEIRAWRTKATRYGQFKIDVCRSCGFAFVNPRPSLDFLMDFYSKLGFGDLDMNEMPTKESILAQEAADPNSILDARRLAATMAGLLRQQQRQPGRFLDVGCGYGFFAVEAIREGFEVTALDLATNKRKVMREITGIEPVASSFEDFECPPSSFSAILMSQILEHVSDVNQWMIKANTMLEKGGILAIALPNFDNAFRYVLRERGPYIIPPEHLNYFNAASLSRLLEKHGFKVESVQWVSRMPRRVIRKRLPRAAAPLVPLVSLLGRAVFRTCDLFRLGLMVNVYARKTGGARPPVR